MIRQIVFLTQNFSMELKVKYFTLCRVFYIRTFEILSLWKQHFSWDSGQQQKRIKNGRKTQISTYGYIYNSVSQDFGFSNTIDTWIKVENVDMIISCLLLINFLIKGREWWENIIWCYVCVNDKNICLLRGESVNSKRLHVVLWL